MTLTIESEEVDQLAETLADRKQIDKTEAVKLAPQNELRRMDSAQSLKERIRPIQERVMSWPSTGLEADKAFYDELSGDA